MERVSTGRTWVYLLLFTGCTINYVDHVVLSVAARPISDEFHLSTVQLGYLFSAFLWSYLVWRCCTDQRKAELALPGRRLGNPDGDGLCGPDHNVQHCDSDGGLAPLRTQAPRTQLGADQVFIPGHCRFGLVPPAIPGLPLPTHTAALGHEVDVAVTRALAAAIAPVRA